MTDIKITPLGAGQDVGRSCILISIGSQNIMLDCGMHMGYNDQVNYKELLCNHLISNNNHSIIFSAAFLISLTSITKKRT